MLLLRPAVPDDAPQLAAVHVEGWRAGYRGLVRDDYLDALRPADREPRWRATAEAGGDLLVAEDAGTLVGFCAAGPCRDDDVPDTAGEVRSLYVRPGRWGGGVGGRLLEATVDRLRATAAGAGTPEPPVLWTLEGNARARAFYERRGWRTDGHRREVHRAELAGVPGVTFAEVRYRLTAAGPAPRER